MAANQQNSELQHTTRRNGELGASARDQAQGPGRRRSSTTRRAARNVGSFGQNRAHRVRVRQSNDADAAALLYSHRARTRSLARIEAEQQQQQRQSNNPLEEWTPSIVLGSSLYLEGEDLNAIEIADRKVAQTRLWASHYAGVPYFDQVHQEAIQERERLDETAVETTTPRSALKSTQASAIQQRLDLLNFLLQDSQSSDERINIEAAITGYKSGAIPYSDCYTLIWAGHIVGRCPDFDSFTADRSARLDHYAAEHGPGWLWYEPPLSNGGGTVVAKKGFCLESKASWRRGTDNMGHYRISMGFKRRKQNVSREANPPASTKPGHRTTGTITITTSKKPPPRRRSAATATATTSSTTTTTPPIIPPQTIPQPNTSQPGRTIPDPDGPRVVWEMLLDSGATLPSLYEGDLPKLGIDRSRYPAQSARTVNTADSVLYVRVYELDVSVLGGERGSRSVVFPQPLPPPPRSGLLASVGEYGGGSGGGAAVMAKKVDDEADAGRGENDGDGNGKARKKRKLKGKDETQPDNAPDATSNPNLHTDPEPLSCTIPVLVFAGDSDDLSGIDHVPGRLSGLLPFHVCYFSGAPGSFKMWMGEDRRDVLGSGRLPGQMRYGEILGGVNAHESARRKAQQQSTSSGLGSSRLARAPPPEPWEQHTLRTPERVIFEHDLPGDAGADILREEDVGDGSVFLRAPKNTATTTSLDKLEVRAKGVQVLRVKRKRQHGEQVGPPYEVKRPVKRRLVRGSA